MFNYKSSTNRTVAVGRYQINHNPGVAPESEDVELEVLAKQGVLVKNGGAVKAPKSASAASTPSGTSKR